MPALLFSGVVTLLRFLPVVAVRVCARRELRIALLHPQGTEKTGTDEAKKMAAPAPGGFRTPAERARKLTTAESSLERRGWRKSDGPPAGRSRGRETAKATASRGRVLETAGADTKRRCVSKSSTTASSTRYAKRPSASTSRGNASNAAGRSRVPS